MVTAGCGNSASGALEEGKTNVVTSFYPVYFLAERIGGEQVNVVNLIASGVEPHDWSPKSQDLNVASKAQLLLYNGAGLEGWVDDFLEGLPADTQLKTKALSDGIELILGNPEEEHEEHEEEGHEDEHDHAGEYDPHTWVSPKSILIMAANVKDALIEVDEANRDAFESNYEKLKAELEELDQSYTTTLAATTKKDIVTSHQSFGYLARDYGLHQVAIMGLTPDAEPKAQDLLEISKFVKENQVKYIFFEELVSDELANTLARETGAETLVLNPVEGLTKKQEQNGDTYITLMQQNLQNLVKALQ
nr:zinc ABC transporter substrate-binding protein [Paenibacillus phyllosphaerae]